MSLSRTILKNIASNWIGYFVQLCVAFVLAPYILNALGQTRYGLWTLAMALTGYYGLLDLGLSSAVGLYITRYLASGDHEGVSRTASTGFVALSCCGFVVVLTTLFIAVNAASWFKIPPAFAGEARAVIAITGGAVAIQFCLLTFSSVFTAVQRFDLSNAIGIASRILTAIGAVIVLDWGYGLIGLSLVLAGANILDYTARWWVSTFLVPSMRISIRLFNKAEFRQLFNFAAWSLVMAGSLRLISYSDSLIIASFMPIAAVAPFAIAVNMRTYFEDIFARASQVLFPSVTALDTTGNLDALRRLYLSGSRLMLVGAIVCGSVGVGWARDFFRLWLGQTYAEPTGYPAVATLFYLLIAGTIVHVSQRIGGQVLLGTRQVRTLATVMVLESVANVVLSVLFVRRFGLVGVALGTLLPAICFEGAVWPVLVCRSLEIDIREYCRLVLPRPVLVAVTLTPIVVTALSLDLVRNWTMLLVCAAATSIAGGVAGYFIGLNKFERGLVTAHVSPSLVSAWVWQRLVREAPKA